MMKFHFIAIANWMVSTVILFAAPMLTFALPKSYVWHAYLFVVAAYSMVQVVDMWNSDSTSRNITILRKAGYTRSKIWAYYSFNLIAFQIPGILLLMYGTDYNTDWDIPTMNGFSMDKVARAVAMVLSTDALFYIVHKLLHEQIPRIHLFHHCCIHSSQTTNLLFHPVDIMLEFSAPTLGVYLMSRYFTNDPSWMFALSTAIIYALYGSEHDEWVASAHTKHHRGCATGYIVYINYFYSDTSKESVRQCLPKLSGPDGLKQVR